MKEVREAINLRPGKFLFERKHNSGTAQILEDVLRGEKYVAHFYSSDDVDKKEGSLSVYNLDMEEVVRFEFVNSKIDPADVLPTGVELPDTSTGNKPQTRTLGVAPSDDIIIARYFVWVVMHAVR